jgi:hypothetical protein
MKKSLLLTLLFSTIVVFSQQKNKIFVATGPSFYSFMKENKDNFNISVSFIHQSKKKRWAMEYYLLYSQNNSNFPSFFYDENARDSYILSRPPETILEDTKWDKTESIEVGGKVHFIVLSKNKINVSANVGLGVNRSKGYQHFLFVSDVLPGQQKIIYGSISGPENGTYAIVFPGVHLDYDLGQNFLIALDGGYHLDANRIQNGAESNVTFWNLSLGIGKKF